MILILTTISSDYLQRYEPITLKQAWLIQLRERLGINRTCIALANKTVRTAWAILRYETKYQQKLLVT